MTRRDFIRRVALGSVVLFARPASVVTLPLRPARLSFDEVNRVTLARILPTLADQFNRTNPLIDYLRGKGISPSY